MQIQNAQEKLQPDPLLPQKRPRLGSPPSMLLSKVDKSPAKKSAKKSTRNTNVEMAEEEEEDQVRYELGDKELGRTTPKKNSPKNKHPMIERSSQRQKNARQAKKVADQLAGTYII